MRHFGFIYTVPNELCSKFRVIIQYIKTLFSKFLYEEDKFLSISIKKRFCFSNKSLGHVTGIYFYKQFALINPPYWIRIFVCTNQHGLHACLVWLYFFPGRWPADLIPYVSRSIHLILFCYCELLLFCSLFCYHLPCMQFSPILVPNHPTPPHPFPSKNCK